ncbi:ABC transporter permease [Nitratireductor aquimarinus]|uniref:ABC transporter permease n=1 Tax=Nitratireductor aquimarinus TaxID=889300 RepID=UPI002936CCA6|nr:ABC transporter permease [Nitratireductor aquimarinus]MDV2968394.1 ABC transporter permease [Nitratireductor aquimarinus]
MADTGSMTEPRFAADRKRDLFQLQMAGILKRLASVMVTLIGLAALTFMIGRMLPIDPVLAILGDNATQEAYDALSAKMGLDRSIPVQFADYLWNLLHLDLGNSLLSGRPVAEEIIRVFPATMELATLAMLIGTAIGVPLGIVAAVYRNSFIDHVARIVSLLGYSAPNFWLGLMGLVLFYSVLGWVDGPGRIDMIYEFDLQPVTGFYLVDAALDGNWEVFGNVFSHLILPALILALSALAYISRMTRTFMIDQLEQEYVIAARAKGIGRWRIVWTHVFRNIAVQVITVVALSYAFLLEGAVLTETVFAWPGFGRYLTNSLLSGDMNSVVGCTLVIGVIFVVLNLICDLLYRVIDPRTR